MNSVNEIVELIKQQLTQLQSPLANFSRTSHTYIFLRAIASVISEQTYLLNSSKLGSNIQTAFGEDLDFRALEFGLSRKPGKLASGFVLIKSNFQSFSIPKGTLLNTVDGAYQFQTLNDFEASSLESPLAIQSLVASNEVNLPAGTKLISPLFPQVTFEVGRFRDLNQKAQIGIQGGLSIESDNDFRLRILNYLSSLGKAGSFKTLEANIKNLPFISKVFIQEHFPIAGFFTVFIDTQDSEQVSEVQTLISELKPLGVNFLIKPILESPVDIFISIQVSEVEDASRVLSNLRAAIHRYFENLELNQTIDPAIFVSIALQFPEILNSQVSSPSNLIIPPSGGLLTLRNLSINLSN